MARARSRQYQRLLLGDLSSKRSVLILNAPSHRANVDCSMTFEECCKRTAELLRKVCSEESVCWSPDAGSAEEFLRRVTICRLQVLTSSIHHRKEECAMPTIVFLPWCITYARHVFSAATADPCSDLVVCARLTRGGSGWCIFWGQGGLVLRRPGDRGTVGRADVSPSGV